MMQGKVEQISEKNVVSSRKADRLSQHIHMIIEKIRRKLNRDRRRQTG